MRLQGKVALITGASSGIGKAIALTFAKEGANIVVNCSASIKKGVEVANLARKSGVEAIFSQADVSDPRDVRKLVKHALGHFKRVDILVNNAGTTFFLPFSEITDEVWDTTMNTNLKGPFLCIRALFDQFMKQKQGVIINVSSISGITGMGSSAAYCVSKCGLIMLTKVVAKAMAPHIRVNCIAPGDIDTPWHSRMPRNKMKDILRRIPLRRIGLPQDIAASALYLASEEASFVTGHTLVVSGGQAML